MMRDVLYVLIGYICGSILFEKVAARFFGKEDITENAPDHNPGAANAFRYGGFSHGVMTLAGDVLKGFVPVFLYIRGGGGAVLGLVMAAPVIGHVFPVLFGFRGGKGIAVTFGCLLGLLPDYLAVVILAAMFIFFSVVVRISPNYYRTLVTYLCTEIAVLVFSESPQVQIGFSLIFAVVSVRLLASREKKSPFEVNLLWMR
ncbi:MAG: glycerol-3-phosphate acyltransferase [Eubacteriales bacterium]